MIERFESPSASKATLSRAGSSATLNKKLEKRSTRGLEKKSTTSLKHEQKALRKANSLAKSLGRSHTGTGTSGLDLVVADADELFSQTRAMQKSQSPSKSQTSVKKNKLKGTLGANPLNKPIKDVTPNKLNELNHPAARSDDDNYNTRSTTTKSTTKTQEINERVRRAKTRESLSGEKVIGRGASPTRSGAANAKSQGLATASKKVTGHKGAAGGNNPLL